jgi:hypothetical protein
MTTPDRGVARFATPDGPFGAVGYGLAEVHPELTDERRPVQDREDELIR